MGSKKKVVEKMTDESLLLDIRRIISKTRSVVTVAINMGVTILYWRVCKRIREEVLSDKSVDYVKEIVATLSR